MSKRSLIAASAAAVLAAGAPVSASATTLPAGYTRHTFIQGNATVSGSSTTSQNAGYVLTDIYPDPAQDTIDAVMSIGEGLSTKELWCARTTATVATFSLLYNAQKKIRFDYYDSYSITSSQTYMPGDTVYIHVVGGTCSLTKAGGASENLTYANQPSFHATGGPLLFSALASYSGSGYGSLAEGYYNNGRLYSFTITRNGAVRHDLVPCVRDSDGTPGLYDTAEGGKFYPGTGSFTMGAIVPSRGHRVEYVESTGEQYVDTLWTPTKDFRAVVDLSFTVTNKGGGGFGYAAAGSVQSFRFWRVLADGAATYKVNINDSSTVVNDLPTTLDTARHVIDISNTAKYIDGVQFGDASGLSKTLASSLYLFAIHFGWDPYVNYGSYRIYSCKLYEGATLIRDFVPYVDANGRACLYDKLSKKPYYNAASGADLVAGPHFDLPTRLMLR